MTTTRVNVADASPGQVVLIDMSGDTATITKVKRPRAGNGDFIKVTFVDDLGSVFTRKYQDGPTPWTLDIVNDPTKAATR